MTHKFLINLVAITVVITSISVGCVDIDTAPEATPTPMPTGFVSIERTFIYDINSNGSAVCTWANTIIPTENSLQYTYHLYGGEAQEFVASDSLGQELHVDAYKTGGEYAITLLLVGYERNLPYQFNLSFLWDGLVTCSDDWHTFYTSVNVDEPQPAKIVVIPPPGAAIELSSVTHGYLTETFNRSVAGDRTVLTWQTPNTGNETEISIRANYCYNLTPTVTPIPTPTPTPTPSNERELVAQYIKMHEPIIYWYKPENGDRTGYFLYTEMVIDNFMEYLEKYNLQPVEIYQQSLILYGPSYGYLYPLDYERYVTREWDYTKEYGNLEYGGPTLGFESAQKYNLEWVEIGNIDVNKPRYNDLPGWSVAGNHYASEDIDNIRAFIKDTLG